MGDVRATFSRPHGGPLASIPKGIPPSSDQTIIREVRKKKASVTDKIIESFRKNVGEEITGEELKYLAKDKKE